MANDDLSYLNGVLGAPSTANNAGPGNNQVSGASTASSSAAAASDTTTTTTAAEGVNGNVTASDALQSPLDMTSLQPILQALKVSLSNDEEFENMSDESISALLAKLDNADLVTDGLENRLDQLLGELDGMLESLESSSADGVEKEIEDAVNKSSKDSSSTTGDVLEDGKLVNH